MMDKINFNEVSEELTDLIHLKIDPNAPTRSTLKYLVGVRSDLYDILESTRPMSAPLDVVQKITNKITEALKVVDNETAKFVKKSATGRWLLQIKGINVTSAAYILSEFGINDNIVCPQQFINYAGYNKTVESSYSHRANIIILSVIDSLADAGGLYGKIIEQNNRDYAGSSKSRFKCGKIFLAHLFCQMYYEKYGKLYESKYNNENVDPEVPYMMTW